MTKKLGLQAFLRREVIKSKLQLPAETPPRNRAGAKCIPGEESEVLKEPEKNTFRDIFGDDEEDYRDPLAKLKGSKTPFAIQCGMKPKTEIRMRIEDLRKQLLAVVDTSLKDSRERAVVARERDRLVRCIERLEAQEQREKDGALRATGVLPEPVSESEKRQRWKDMELVRKAIRGEEKTTAIKRRTRPLDDDPDGETRKMLGLPLKRRKLQMTGKWTEGLRGAVPEVRCEGFEGQWLRGVLMCGASVEQRVWLGEVVWGLEGGVVLVLVLVLVVGV